MQTRCRLTLALGTLALAAASFSANAAIVFQSLGTNAPTTTIGGAPVTPFDQVAQAAIPFNTDVTAIPGSPIGGVLTLSSPAYRRAVGNGWNTSWSHGYTGPLFFVHDVSTVTLSLPPNTRAFYFYIEGDAYGTNTFTITTNSGATSGPVQGQTNYPGTDGAAGFAVYSTAGETISTITINNIGDVAFKDFSIAEFGIGTVSGTGPTSCASEGYTGLKLEWCKNICEKGYTGTQLKIWINRWMDRYHDLPYCAREGTPPPQGE